MDKFWENYITTRPVDSKGAFDAFKQMHQDPRSTIPGPRNMQLAKAYDVPDAFNPDLEQTEVLRPGETLEDWKPNPFLKPHAEGGRAGYNDGQLVTPSVDGSRPGYANPKGNPLFGKEITGTMLKGRISDVNQKKLNKLIEIITESNNSYKKTLTSKETLIKAGWKDGWQSIATEGNLRKSINKEIGKLNNTYQKIDNYVNNVMLGENALVKDFEAPMKHIQKKFGVSVGTTDIWVAGNKSGTWKGSKVYGDNKKLFHNLRNKLSMNKYKLLPDGSPRLISDLSEIVANKLPTVSGQGMFSQAPEIRTILDSAKRNYLQMTAAGKTPKVRFITDPALTPINEWQFIDNETGRLFSTDASIDKVTFEGRTYKNNYLNHVDSRKLYKKEFGNIYKMYDEDLVKYMDTMVVGKNGKPIKLDTLLRRQAKELTGKQSYLERRMMEFDHADLWDDPFGRKKGGLRLIDRRANQQAGIYKQIYKDNPKLLTKKLNEIGYNKKFKNTNELIKFYSDRATGKSFSQIVKAANQAGFMSEELLKDTAKGLGKGAKKIGSVARKLGAEFEVGLIGLDYLNNLDSMDSGTAFKQALENATLGMYKGGQKAHWKDFQQAGKELGHNTENLSEVKNILDLEKMLKSEKHHLQNLKDYLESGDPTLLDDSLADLQTRLKAQEDIVPKLENEYQKSLNTLFAKDNADDILKNYDDTVSYVGRKGYNKDWEKKLDRVDSDMGPIGSSAWQHLTDWGRIGDKITPHFKGIGYPKNILPQNIMENIPVTRPYVRALRKIPGIGSWFDPTSEQAKLSAMSLEDKMKRAKALNIQEQYYHPVTGSTMTEQQMEPYYERYYASGGRAYYMGGGIAGIRRPGAIPPESGPQPEGLENLKYYVTNT